MKQGFFFSRHHHQNEIVKCGKFYGISLPFTFSSFSTERVIQKKNKSNRFIALQMWYSNSKCLQWIISKCYQMCCVFPILCRLFGFNWAHNGELFTSFPKCWGFFLNGIFFFLSFFGSKQITSSTNRIKIMKFLKKCWQSNRLNR